MNWKYSDKALMNEVAGKSDVLHLLTEEERQGLRQVLLKMYDDLANLCKHEGLCLMLGGGSCLGAIRHKGFIPWDDDLDLMMPRQDYDFLLTLLKQGALNPQKYEFAFPDKGSDSPTHFLKIYLRGSLDVEIMTADSPFPKGIFLDIFPIEGAPGNMLRQKFNSIISFILRSAGTCVAYQKFSGSILDSYAASNPKLQRAVKRKKSIGRCLSVIPHRVWMRMFDNFVKQPCTPDGYATIPTGRNHYSGELQPSNVFFPTIEVDFEGRKANVPGDFDSYLRGLYGANYMQLPPENKRERHFVYEFAIPEL